MSKATVYTTSGDEIEVEYIWKEETYTTIEFHETRDLYSAFSKFNITMWSIDDREE